LFFKNIKKIVPIPTFLTSRVHMSRTMDKFKKGEKNPKDSRGQLGEG